MTAGRGSRSPMASPSPGPPDTVAAGAPRAYRLRAVLFDFDGTLTEPDALDFPAAKRDLGCPPEQLLLEWVQSLPPGERRATALAGLEAFELAGDPGQRINIYTAPPDSAADEALRLLASWTLQQTAPVTATTADEAASNG